MFLNAIANQLRFPNSHTHYFSCTLLYLFAEANSEAIQEQITRLALIVIIIKEFCLVKYINGLMGIITLCLIVLQSSFGEIDR